jgi:hypothetical protein
MEPGTLTGEVNPSDMRNDKTFPLSIDYEGHHYSGEVMPSEETGSNGTPVFFRVTIGGEFFAYLCCGDLGWNTMDDSGKQNGLVGAIGNYIMEYYE